MMCGSVAQWIGRWTCDYEVAGSIPAAALSSANLDKLFTHIFQRLWCYNLMALYKSVYIKKQLKNEKISACEWQKFLSAAD